MYFCYRWSSSSGEAHELSFGVDARLVWLLIQVLIVVIQFLNRIF